MKLSHRYVVAGILIAGLVLPFVFAPLALANPGLRISGAKLIADVAPGQTITHTMTISIMDADPPLDMLVDVTGFGQSLEGAPQVLEDSEDISPFSARSFITLDATSFHLDPGDSQQVTATICIPQDVSAGGRYALIDIRSQPIGEGSVGVVTAVAVPIALTIKGSELIHEGKITEVSTSDATSGQPVDIFTTFQNTGNHYFKIKGEVTVSDASGETLDTISLPLTASSVMPTLLRQLKATFIPEGELLLGVYSVKSRVMLEDDTVLDEAAGSFEVKEPYVPPSPPASVTLIPGRPATLETGDGRISISFPKGAVISQVEISLRSYPLEELPSPPADFSLATTCFRIDGLAGLLAKEATVTVKFTPADLERAEGDASRLTLARWDEANNQWLVLKTKVDKEAMTLSTTTNQFGLWAVMVAPPAAPFNLLLIISIGAGVIIVGIAILLVVLRRRRQY